MNYHYKDTIIDWFGKVPEHWKISKVNHNIPFKTGFTPSTQKQEFYGGEYNWATIDDLNGGVITKTKSKLTELGIQGREKKLIKKGSLFYSFKLSVGQVGFAGEDMYTNEAIASFEKNDSIDINFLYYSFLDYLLYNAKENIYGAKLLNSELIKNSKILVPPLQEQKEIAIYLDKACERIDKIIKIKGEQLLNMEANIQALINEFVTGKKALKSHNKYKSSNIEWLGDMPNSWETKRLFNICYFVRGNSSFKKDELLDEGKYVALQYGKTYKVEEVNKEFKFYVNDNFYKSSQIVNYGDVIFVSTSETLEDLGHSVFYNRNDIGLIGGEQILLKPKKNILDGKFLFYTTKVFGKELNKFATGLKVFRFDVYDLKTIYIPIPPLKEQKAIAEHLDKSIAKIKKVKSIIQSQIETLQVYRKSLIHECVTGKKQVVKTTSKETI